jgi:preprotein translocase subunit SecA
VASQRAAVYSQRRAFLTSSDEGMLETFTRFSLKTLDEIYEASYKSTGTTSGGASSSSNTANVNAEKLVSKTKQFFSNLEITVAEVIATPPNKLQQLLQQRLMEAIKDKKGITCTNTQNIYCIY